ncbi:MAG TPA: DNA gyrase/topoisomerase IV subunit A [Bacteroidales bacterium]|nr:DNA gyrase/topoisomerase IV subunit A [Bacteroidales bacterium]HPB25984.1 DNA gyrase/topoisomerase IV subunit A [Bacteroidales bacterium]HPI30510.1 DNA gyrase/topoisomerase IV subunit A [Bacteroidales bacterium]HQN16618.1 DNA gyrase/topoisomerase IV subunit A [Bacteroidales bacterium]HQP16300.1 DNA gyrase/topoisomerase IV subunit A [Bacteroidales bacterium]
MEDEILGKNENQDTPKEEGDTPQVFPKTQHLTGMYKNWFLDYASYVNLDRAVPDIRDGLKPVQRRILHSLKELDDGRFNKAANIIGNTMKYHPHGDASIGEALVILGQKDLLVETQGNWGNILTGDSAAAPRYIEARLSKFALEVVFNPKTTIWQASYDGRNREPVTLPVKFPLLLAQGVEGIGVGLSSKILPHNFIEIIDACIKHLRNEEFELLPDFPTGGMIDVSKYNDGARGGKVRIRARISQEDKKTLVITEIPFGTTTVSLIDSIVAANDKGKIKIKKIEDNTAAKVEIVIHLAPGVSPDTTIDALYAFTACETSISPICCIIDDQKPRFITVHEILEDSVQHTLDLLQSELEIEKAECLEQLHFSTLERIFIEKEVYQLIRKSKTDKEIDDTIDKGLKPYTKLFIRKVTIEDIHRLRKIPIERISKYNSDKAEDIINSLKDDIEQVDYDLDHLVDYAITYYERLKMKYSKGRERKTEIKNFDVIQATMVAIANQKLYVNRQEGFIGTGIKKDEYVCDCSDIDDILTFREDGTFMLSKVADKVFVGKNIIHVAVYKRFDERTIYNMVYRDGKNGNAMVKRFAVTGVNRDKEYVLTKGTADSKVLYFTANPNGEAEIVNVSLRPKPRLKILSFDFDFSTLAIKGRNSIGNILSKNPVRKITLKDSGISTLSERDVWFDESVNRLNTEQRGKHLGSFAPEDKIITFMKSGHFRIYNNDLSIHFDEDLLLIEKYNPDKVYTVIYFDGESGLTFVKRFTAEDSDKKQFFISETPGSQMIEFMPCKNPVVELTFELKNARSKPSEIINLVDFIGVKSFKAKGKRLSNNQILTITPVITEEPPEEPLEGTENIQMQDDGPADATDEEKNEGNDAVNDDTDIEDGKEAGMDSQTDENNEVKDEEVQEKKPAVEPHEKKTKTPKTIIEKASREETLPKEPEKPAPEATPPTTQKKGTKKTKGKNDFPGAIQIEFEF